MTIHQIESDVDGYKVQVRFETVAGEVTSMWVLDDSFSPEDKPPEWLLVDHALFTVVFERSVNDYLANLDL